MWVRAMLLTASGLFAVLGLSFAQDPVGMASIIGLPTDTAQARIAVRAFYGGTQVGLAGFFLYASLHPHWHPAAAASLALMMGGMFVGRTAGLVTTGSSDGGELALLLVNFMGAMMATLTWWIAQVRDPEN